LKRDNFESLVTWWGDSGEQKEDILDGENQVCGDYPQSPDGRVAEIRGRKGS